MSYSVKKEVKDRFPKIMINLVLALAFAIINITISEISIISKDLLLLLGTALMFSTLIFLGRALVNVLAISDKATRLFVSFLGIKEGPSRSRALKDLAYIIVIILIATAIYPISVDLGGVGYTLQTITTYIALALIFVFIYDIGRTLYKISEEKMEVLTDLVFQRDDKERNENDI